MICSYCRLVQLFIVFVSLGLFLYILLCFSLIILFSNIFWQLCSGVDENAAGACAQLVFAPIDESFADDAPLLPSGFRVIPLDPKSVQ